ncbi:class I adenylate-forming enzyme family protein [Paenibacillus xylanexedens]|uniref:Acyl-CoA synthetase (AMP-forming)/AMP-acid ligase II n=1 Tax=Paenibacillus xylanexedens TaxID=528191 RepID=A0ABS4RSI1_PAEXY|nr:class I adenylate-forming enzyme family protein [Paenibacillus xylanexedens]MBP2245836.1 acyl-CoA synthetase (AMP-forming)/AMP-acid ligase II [Paenibacillus xylanexedens]
MNRIWDFISTYINNHSSSIISDHLISKSYKEILETVDLVGNKLKLAIRPKSKCIILCEREFNTMLAVLACWKADIVPIILSNNYGVEHGKKIIEKSRPHLFICDNNKNFVDPALDTNLPVFSITNGELTGKIDTHAPEYILEDVALIMFTSGTTGEPKGALITEKGLIANVDDIAHYFNINDKDKILISRPLYHSGVITGELLVSLVKGVNIQFLDQKYNPRIIMEEILKNEITVFGGTPTLLHHLAFFTKRSAKKLGIRVIAISGECLSAYIAKEIRHVFGGIDIYHVYGLTEAAPRVSCLSPNLFDQYPESVGQSLRSVELRIVDDMGNTVGPNIDGNLLVRGPNIMKGYYNSNSTPIIDGWLWTKDIACVDDAGLIFIKARADEMIIKGGMNIYPQEIERLLMMNPDIKDIIAYGIRKKEGMRIGINIVLSENVSLDKREIMSICSKSLSPYLLPDEINVVKTIDKNASGKVIRPKIKVNWMGS